MKKTISIIVIVIALAGAGIFGYLTFFKSSSEETGLTVGAPKPVNPVSSNPNSSTADVSANPAAANPASPAAAQTSASGGSSQILPMGSSLNFDSIEKYNSNNRLFAYPAVSAGEIGLTLGEIVKQ